MGEQLGLDDVSSFYTHSTIKNEDFYDLAENAVGGNCEEVNGQLAVTASIIGISAADGLSVCRTINV